MGSLIIKNLNENVNENIIRSYINYNNHGIIDYYNLVKITPYINDMKLLNLLRTFDTKYISNVGFDYLPTGYNYYILKYIDVDGSIKKWKIEREEDLGFPYVYWDWFEEVNDNFYFERDDLFKIVILINTINNNNNIEIKIDSILTDANIKTIKKSKKFIDSYIINSNTRYDNYMILNNNNYELIC